MIRIIAISTFATMPVCFAQGWGIGPIGGFAVTRGGTVSNGSGSVSAGLKSGPVFGVVAGADDHKYVGGEITYLYQQSDFRLKGSGAEPTFDGHTQYIDFRVTVHSSPRDAAVRPFLAAGGGAAVYTGTGTESSRQPLNNFAALTATRQTTGMISVGGGLKVRLSRHLGMRVEVRDNITPFPDKIITPVPGASASGWLHNIIPSVALVLQ